jgi:hypothetical protein
MEPIERDLEERKARLHRLAIELQRLGEAMPRAGTKARRERDAKIADCRRQIEAAKFGIRELQEILAEGRRQKSGEARRPRPPDLSRRRALTDAERKRIATRYKRELLARLRAHGREIDAGELTVHVERVTDLEGQPICTFALGPSDDGA